MFLLNFRIFAEVMFLAGATKDQSGGRNCGDGFAKTKMHSAPQTNRVSAFYAR